MPLEQVRVGDPIRAAQWNRLVSTVNDNALAVGNGFDGGIVRPWIKNLSDVDVEPFQVMELTTPLFEDDADKLADFLQLTSWKGVKATASGLGNFAVMATSAETGAFGQVYNQPIVPAMVEITKDWIDTCDLNTGQHKLITKLEGTARILWKAAASGSNVRCIIQRGQVIDRFYWGVTQSTINPDSTGTVRVYEPGGVADWVDIANVNLDHCHDDTAVQNNTDVRIWFSQLDLEWHIDGAACEPN